MMLYVLKKIYIYLRFILQLFIIKLKLLNFELLPLDHKMKTKVVSNYKSIAFGKEILYY